MNENGPDWFAVHTRYQHENIVVAILALKGFRTFLPTYKEVRQWKDRRKAISLPLFPGYVFTTEARERRIDILSTPGVCRILAVQGVPAKIPCEEMDAITRILACPESLQPHPFLRQGERVIVTSGPLRGVEGILVSTKDKARLVVSIQMLGRAASVEVDPFAATGTCYLSPKRRFTPELKLRLFIPVAEGTSSHVIGSEQIARTRLTIFRPPPDEFRVDFQ
jgi:transcription antitermination factor NusG